MASPGREEHNKQQVTEEEINEEEKRNEESEAKTKEIEEMKPWEQHSSVISMPRFDYKAPSSLLRHSHSGFLVTCSIKREKSATKEAMSILGKFIRYSGGVEAECFDDVEATVSVEKRRICEEKELDLENLSDGRIAVDESQERGLDTKAEISSTLSLVKLTKSGLLLLTFPAGVDVPVVDTLSDFFASLEGGSVPSLQWCHRIFPIQATCGLDEKELQTVVCRLIDGFLTANQNKTARPLKFAVGYNRRGIEEETEVKNKRASSSDCTASSLLDRSKCFSLVASAVKKSLPDSVVDLKCPEVAVLVEVLPVSGIPVMKVVVGVSVLPGMLVSTKPKLCVKALVSDNIKSRTGRKQININRS